MDDFRVLIKEKRKELGLTQEDLALTAGVGLRFVRDLEQGKKTIRVDKVNQVLQRIGRHWSIQRIMVRRAFIYYQEDLAGYLSEIDSGYEFLYDETIPHAEFYS